MCYQSNKKDDDVRFGGGLQFDHFIYDEFIINDRCYNLLFIRDKMDCKYVRESLCLSAVFHPSICSLFILSASKPHLRIIQQNLYTGLIMNEFPVPLREQVDADNCSLCWMDGDVKGGERGRVILAVGNRVLVYEVGKGMRGIVFVGEVGGKTPYFIEKIAVGGNTLFFSASEQHNLYGINIDQCIKSGSIQSYAKYKLPQEATSLFLSTSPGKLLSLCSDLHLRIYDIESGSPLKGILLEKIGLPSTLAFSKDFQYLLVGSEDGWIQCWDGNSLGVNNIMAMSKQVSREKIQGIAWFHYSGEAGSKRFLVMTADGNVKLYSFFFEKTKEIPNKYIGRANQLSLLYITRSKLSLSAQIISHPFSNFIFFSPGVLLFLVDHHSKLYYPVVPDPLVRGFQELVPNNKKEVSICNGWFFIDGMMIKRVRNDIEVKADLQAVLEYEELKILKMDYRPKFADVAQLPKTNQPSKLRYKFLITYYLGSMTRCILLSDLTLATPQPESVEHFKEYSGHAMIFLGNPWLPNPLLFILQEDRQTVQVIGQGIGGEGYGEQEKRYMTKAGQIYNKTLKIKIQRVFQTPFRNSYVLLYQSQNLLRFSNNIQLHSDLLDFDVFPTLSLRLDFTSILIDVLWSHQGHLGCILCLSNAIFINDELKVIRSVPINGYVVQGMFIGYTLLVVTKMDVQYIDVGGKAHQMYCGQRCEDKWVVSGIMVDRIIIMQKTDNGIVCKTRFFNLLEPLLSGYLHYYKMTGMPINPELLKRTIQCFAPYTIVSQEFLELLNNSHLSSFSKYFIQSNVKLYSRSLRGATLNAPLKIERFINEGIWARRKKDILNLFLYYEQNKDSTDAYQLEKCKQHTRQLKSIVGEQSFNSMKQALREDSSKAKLTITNSFGEKNLFQIYYQFNEKENMFIKMDIEPFKAENVGQWVGLFSMYIESKVADNQSQTDKPQYKPSMVTQESNANEEEKEGEDEDGDQFKDLLVYYRCDDGKGEIVDDLSNYANEGKIIASAENQQFWEQLDEQPMQLCDQWGKKCPKQFCINGGIIARDKKINGKNIVNFSIQIWFKNDKDSYRIVQVGDKFEIGLKQLVPYIKSGDSNIKMQIVASSEQSIPYHKGNWNQFTFVYNKKQSNLRLFLNSIETHTCKLIDSKLMRDSLKIGDGSGQFTEFRFWRRDLDIQQIKNNLRMPLQLVAEKWKEKKFKARIKDKKKKSDKEGGEFFPAFQL